MGISQPQNLRTPPIEKLRPYGIRVSLPPGDPFRKLAIAPGPTRVDIGGLIAASCGQVSGENIFGEIVVTRDGCHRAAPSR